MANLITFFRFLLLYALVVLVYNAPPRHQVIGAPVLVLMFILDGLDGYVARKRHEESLFGAIFDIAVDRVVENVLWLVLADLDLVPIWVPIVFLTRGFMVDAVRSHGVSRGLTPFASMRTPIGRFLVAGRMMRTLYAIAKAVTFTWYFLLLPLPATAPDFFRTWGVHLYETGAILTAVCVTLCLVRGLPVLIEFVQSEYGRPGGRQATSA